MTPALDIFSAFQLPNPTTWFYFSFLLAVALFFRFSRFLSIRNWDVVMLFLMVPGLLLLKGAQNLLAEALSAGGDETLVHTAKFLRWIGYLWLLCGSGYLFVRCLIDLALVRRPALTPNLNLGGLAWLAGSLSVCLVSVAFRTQEGIPETVGKRSVAVEGAERGVETAAAEVNGLLTRPWVGAGLAIVCHLVVVAGLVVIGCRHFQDALAGMAAATFYLLLPYTAIHVGQLHHVWPAALIVWAVAFYRFPIVAGLFLGLAAGSVYFPALLFPVWFSFYWRRGAGRFLGGFLLAAGLSLAVTGMILWLQGDFVRILRTTLTLSDWQAWRQPTPSTESFWLWLDGAGVHWVYRIPVFIAYLAFVFTTLFWPSPKNLAHVLALSAALLIGVQFWYADRGGVYVLWYLPLLLLMVFRPNLADRLPPPIPPDGTALTRWLRSLGRRGVRLLKLPEPTARVR